MFPFLADELASTMEETLLTPVTGSAAQVRTEASALS
jgi:hypothetical protein